MINPAGSITAGEIKAEFDPLWPRPFDSKCDHPACRVLSLVVGVFKIKFISFMFVVEYRAEKRLVSNIVHRLMGCTYERVSETIRSRHSQLTSTRFTGGFPSVCSSPEKGVS